MMVNDKLSTYLRWLTLPRLVSFVTFAAVIAIASRPPVDADVWWHLRAGQQILETRQFIFQDVFSSTRLGTSWIDVYWLIQIALYLTYQVLGEPGLLIFTVITATAGMAAIYNLSHADPLVKAFAFVLAATTAAVFWSGRPQMISFVLSAIVLSLIWRYQNGDMDRLWIIPILMIPWANMHLGFSIAFILLGLAIISEAGDWLLSRLSKDAIPSTVSFKGRLGKLLVISLISVAALLINPYGIEIILHPFRTIGISILRDYIQEWAAPNFHETRMWPFAILLVATPLVAALSTRRLTFHDGVFLSGTALNALLAARNIPIFALVAAPILADHLDAWLKDNHITINTARISTRGVALIGNWLIALIVVFAVVVRAAASVIPTEIRRAEREIFPVGAVRYLSSHQAPGKLLNSYNWGGYLIWHLRDYPVYVDGRTDLYDDAMLKRYLLVYLAQPGWESILEEDDINIVLIESTSPLAQVLRLSPKWRPVYGDSLSVLYLRATPLEITP